jgi:amidohydrolase
VHADAHGAFEAGACERSERGQVACVVAGERAGREPLRKVSHRGALVDVDRWPYFDRHAGPQGRETVPVGNLLGSRSEPGLHLGCGAPVQRHADPRLHLDERRTEILQLLDRSGDRVEMRLDARIDRTFAVDELLHAVQTDESHTGHGNLRSEELDGTAAHDGDASEARREPPQLLDRLGQRPRIIGVLDDRRQRTIEIAQERCASRIGGEHRDDCIGILHGATLPGMDAKAAARSTVDDRRDDLVALSHRIHAHPELKWEEEQSSAWTAGALADAGLSVDMGVCDLPTAFTCVVGGGPLHLAICAEYDALPEIGHACGHNVIAAAAVGAGLALAPLVDELGITLHVMGTPAEEGGGGKVFMLERGAFDGVHAAMMVHPTPNEDIYPRVSAVAHVHVSYTGRAAHAALAPHLGVNAGDAFTVAQVAIGLLRQHLRPTDQVHGVVLNAGQAANVVPAHAEGLWMARARTIQELEALRPRVMHCFEAGALATGASLRIDDVSPDYAHMEHDHDIGELYRANAQQIGRPPSADGAGTFSTDMGNVSLAMPSIHPCLSIETGGAVNHQPEFAAAAVNASADQAVAEGALGMAWTAIDIATGPLRERLLRRRR